MKRFLVIPGLLVLGLLSGVALAACGGDSAPETPIVVTDTTQNLSKAEFISQADAICEEGNTQIADIAAAGEGITRAAEVAQIRQQMATDIRDLGTPVDDGTTSPSTSTSSSSLDTGSTSTTTTHDTSTFPEGPSTTGGTDTGTSTGTGTGTATGTDTSATATPVSGDPLETFLTALEAAATAGEKIDLANQRGEATTEGEAELADAKDQASAAATEYGFEQCGTDGTASGTTTSSSSGTATPSAPSTAAPSTPSAPSDGGSTDGGSSGGGVSPGGGV
ncbi:MAG: hypothetical protein ACXWDP_06150, partial [Solirubrobacterales bacterium]